MLNLLSNMRKALISVPVAAALLPGVAEAGTWAPVTGMAPDFAGTMLQLTDGTVMTQGSSPHNKWFRLTPNSLGSYVGGIWSAMPSMNTPRLYYVSHVLRNGDVWILGGEYSGNPLSQNWTNTGEKYSYATNSWNPIASHPETEFGDVPTMLMDGDKILVGSLSTNNTYFYNIATNTWSAQILKVYNDRSDEETWVKMPGNKVLTYDLFSSVSTGGSYAEYFDTKTWVSVSPSDSTASGAIPQLSSSSVGYEMGGALRLCDGRIFIIGAGAGNPLISHTALYNPNTKTWAAGPDIPNNYLADDAPAAVMPNCHVLLAADAGHFSAPTKLYDYSPGTNTITELSLPSALATQLNNIPVFQSRMLVLPTGQVMLTTYTSKQAWIYTPDATALSSSLLPVVSTIAPISTGNYRLTGLRLTGLSSGASFGDDVESDENYPIIRLISSAGLVYYTKTSNWSTTDVGTGNAAITTDFCVKPNTPAGNYKMYVSAAGLQSAPVSFTLTAASTSCL